MVDSKQSNNFVNSPTNPIEPTPALKMAEDILGCKWSLTVLQLVRQGICRPGAMERTVEGLSTKVLNERLRKLTRYNILQRHAYAEVPPRVEYGLTDFGSRFISVLDQFSQLDEALEQTITDEK